MFGWHEVDNLEDITGTDYKTGGINIIKGSLNTTISTTCNHGDNISDLGYQIDQLIKLAPSFKDYFWGGTKLRDVFGMDCDFDIIAESWLLSAHPDGPSIVSTGEHRGINFIDYLELVGKDVLGWKCSPLQTFPLLIKFIDAKGNLSVQVHPNDDYALEKENQYGKNEMWYVIEAEQGAGLYVGFNKDVSREEVENRVKDNTILEVLNFYPTHSGDVFFIPAGTVHAIGQGNLICEIQQSSNCTYRLYDYDRRDKYGNPRELQLDKALDVLNYSKYEQIKFQPEGDSDGTVLSSCKYFKSTVYDISNKFELQIDNTVFHSLVCIKGSGEASFMDSTIQIKAGESIFVPALNGVLTITGKLSVVISHI